MFILPSPVFCCLILHLPLHSVSSNNTLQVRAWNHVLGRGEGPCCVSDACDANECDCWEKLGRVGCYVFCPPKLKPVGFPFTNGTCWCYSSIPSCKPSWFWSSITTPPFPNHFSPLPPLPLRAIPSPHTPTPCDVLHDNILLDQTHINSVLMPAEEAVANQLTLRSCFATILYRLPGPRPTNITLFFF